jgi:HrpA-like RNA helicase
VREYNDVVNQFPLHRIVALVRERRAAVITAPPGAGKTTRVPPALSVDGPVLLLQPRRVAARAIARHIGQQQKWIFGREVGWQVRFERRYGPDTRLLVATEGILTARLQDDPLLTAFRTVIIDEFHERSIHADVGLALAREAWRARSDLRLVVMSATIDAQRVAAYLDEAPIVDVPGRMFPIDVVCRPNVPVEDAVADAVRESRGAVLCFLPGAPEIRRTLDGLAPRLAGVPVMPLHGSLDADEQDAAIAPTGDRRVILATNIAETTLTVPPAAASADEALVRLATRVEREWLTPTASDVRYDMGGDGAVRAWRVERYEQLTLAEHPMPPDPDRAREALATEYLRRPRSERDEQLRRRLRFAGIDVARDDLVRPAARSARRLGDIQIEEALTFDQRRALDRHAPLTIPFSNGRRARLDYRDDGRVVASVKLQHLFGVVDTPALGANRVPVTFELLAPNGRPVQVTQDLRSFWMRGYPEVRKQLRGRYPKHRWPEDPGSP